MKIDSVEEHPLVSYLVPAYNHSRFVAATLDSIVADGYPNMEILMIDDGSTDETLSVATLWKSRHPEIQFHLKKQTNQGVSATLNALINLARGEHLRFCASDDLMAPESTQKMILALLKEPTSSAVIGDCLVIGKDGETLHTSSLDLKGSSRAQYKRNIVEAIIRHWAVVGPSLLVRKSFFLRYGMFEESLSVEDWFLYLKFAANNKIIFIDETVASYRIHDENASGTRDPKKRIVNLQSQMKAGILSLANFSFPAKAFLLAQIALLRAKICYLQKSFLVGGAYLFAYYVIDRCLLFIWRFPMHDTHGKEVIR